MAQPQRTYESVCAEFAEALRPKLTKEFLDTLVQAVRTYGWRTSPEYQPVVDFAIWCLDQGGESPLVDLRAFVEPAWVIEQQAMPE
jgi:hypothetical protein